MDLPLMSTSPSRHYNARVQIAGEQDSRLIEQGVNYAFDIQYPTPTNILSQTYTEKEALGIGSTGMSALRRIMRGAMGGAINMQLNKFMPPSSIYVPHP